MPSGPFGEGHMEWKFVAIGLIAGIVVGYLRVNQSKTPNTPAMFH